MNKPEQPKVDYTNIVNTLGEGSQVIMVVSSTVGNTKYSMTKLADTSTFAIHAVNSLTAIGPPVEFVSPNPEDNCVPFKVGEELFFKSLDDPGRMVPLGALENLIITRRKANSRNKR